MNKETMIPTLNIEGNLRSNSTISTNGDVRVGISACLLGQNVRYNGGHSQSRLCLDLLANHFVFQSFCPEVAAGFGTPRPTMRLVALPEKLALTWSKGANTDLSAQLKAGFQKVMSSMGELDGYILMGKSPSCGLHKVKVYRQSGEFSQQYSQGLYAAELQKRYPLLPMEDEGRLQNPHLRENFLLRVFANHNFKREVLIQPSLHALIEFHKSYKYVLMAHSQKTYKQLGRLLANMDKKNVECLVDEYFKGFMLGIAKPANSGNHANVLLHLLGYLKKTAPSEVRQSIAETIMKYRNGLVPLITPITLLNHYVTLCGSDYVKAQRYFQPYPEQLGLTNVI